MIRLFLLILLFFINNIIYSHEQYEKRHILYNGDSIVYVGNSITLEVNEKFLNNTRKYLRVVGAGIMPGKFMQRGETIFREMEYLIDDYLDSVHVKNDRYSLLFCENNRTFEQCAYYRIENKYLKSNRIDIEFYAEAEKLRFLSGGRIYIQLQVYNAKKGRHRNDIFDAPDTILTIPIQSGDYKFKKYNSSFFLSQKPAAVLVKISGINYTGICRVEAPKLKCGDAIINDISFLPNSLKKDNENYWVGVNFVSKYWPLWSIKLNGHEICNKKIFDRASYVADFYVNIPDSIIEVKKLSLTLLNENSIPHFPYKIKSIEIIEEKADDFEIISIPKYVVLGDTIGVLVELNNPDISLEVYPNEHYEVLSQPLHFKNKGLEVIRIKASKIGNKVPIIISDGIKSKEIIISQILYNDGQRVYISSGDEIYIDKNPLIYNYFFKWYFRERIGNWFQFRPSYQWSGMRDINETSVGSYINLLNKMNVPFAWQVDGRTLAGKNINAPLSILNSMMFRGKQAHENDGGYYYWTHFQNEGLFTDIRARYLPWGGIFAKKRPIYTDKGKFVHYNPYGINNMQEGAELFVSNLSSSRGNSIRHTGPSTMFRYLYQAGYEWLGAEQMYGPEEVILSALRGASKAYGKSNYGTLHAMQWGSSPFTDPHHALRMYLSLALAYIHGSSHLNTEEGLWIDEYANDRYSIAGKEHIHAQNLIFDYIETHSRKGNLNSNVAILQGRNCSWKCFGRTSMWSQIGDKWNFNFINESFDLLKIFYPDNILDCCGPQGWFSKSPYGSVDILPIEADESVINQYNVLVFLGWNTYNDNDFIKLLHFVEKGGTLMLSGAHMNINLQPNEKPQIPFNNSILCKLLGENYMDMKEKTEIRCGKGRVIYFPQLLYPSEKGLRHEYEYNLQNLAYYESMKEYGKGMIIPKGKVEFTCWDSEEKRTIYLLNMDWENLGIKHNAELRLNGKSFPISVRQYNIETIHCAFGLGVHPMANTSDVLSIKDNSDFWEITVQTTDKDSLYIYNGITGKTLNLNISSSGVTNMRIDKY